MFDKIYDLNELVHLNDQDTASVPTSELMHVEDVELMKMIASEPSGEHGLDDLTLADDWPQTLLNNPPANTIAASDDGEPLTTRRFGRYGEIYGGYLD